MQSRRVSSAEKTQIGLEEIPASPTNPKLIKMSTMALKELCLEFQKLMSSFKINCFLQLIVLLGGTE